MPRVLLVEDDDAFRIFCRVALQAEGFEVLEARDGTVGLALAQREIPDLLILDLWLPGLTGSGVLRTVRADTRLDHVPVLVLSGVPEVKDRDGLYTYGADDVLEKPISPELLVAAVKTRLRLGRSWVGRRRRGVGESQPDGNPSV